MPTPVAITGNCECDCDDDTPPDVDLVCDAKTWRAPGSLTITYAGLDSSCIYPNTVGGVVTGTGACTVGSCTFSSSPFDLKVPLDNSAYVLRRRCVASDQCCAFYQYGNLTPTEVGALYGFDLSGCDYVVSTGCDTPSNESVLFKFVGSETCSGEMELFGVCCAVSYEIHSYLGFYGGLCLDSKLSPNGAYIGIQPVGLQILVTTGVGVPGTPSCDAKTSYTAAAYTDGSPGDRTGYYFDPALYPLSGDCLSHSPSGSSCSVSLGLTGMPDMAPAGSATIACCGGATISLS